MGKGTYHAVCPKTIREEQNMYEYYLPFIGKKSERLYHRVSADSIRAFAQAIGEENPVYLDEEYAKTTKYGRMIAPPTYCLSLKTADIPGLWIAPVGRIHAGQRFVWNRPIYADEVVSIEQVITNTFEKAGKKGLMVFLEQTKNVYDADENLICSFIVTTITMDKLFPKDLENLSVASAESAAAKWQARPSPKMAVGLVFPEVQLPPVKRMDFVYYAGASGDFNTIHVIDSSLRSLPASNVCRSLFNLICSSISNSPKYISFTRLRTLYILILFCAACTLPCSRAIRF